MGQIVDLRSNPNGKLFYVSVVSACTDCMLTHANGESGEDPDMPPLGKVADGTEVTMGLLEDEHSDGCTKADRDSGECRCEDLGFSWASCETCGSHLGGDRFALSLWEPITAEQAEELGGVIG